MNPAHSSHGPARGFAHAASLILLAMAVVAFADVVLRAVNRPITGAHELTSLLMGLLVYSALPLVTAQDAHVRAGVLQMWTSAPGWARTALLRLRRVLSAVAFAYLTWALLAYAGHMAAAGDRIPYIEVPLSWVAGFGAAATGLSGVMALWARHTEQDAQ